MRLAKDEIFNVFNVANVFCFAPEEQHVYSLPQPKHLAPEERHVPNITWHS
jgi:hypothetical protein